jgi:hypothetical protein
MLVIRHELHKLLNLASIRVHRTHLTLPHGGYCDPDFVLTVDFKDHPGGLTIAIEHQSTVQTNMALRASQICNAVYFRTLDKDSSSELYPLVVVVVLAHGKTWNAPTELRKLLSGIEAVPSSALDLITHQSFELYDVAAMTSEQIDGLAVSSQTKLFLLALRHGRDPEFVGMLDEYKDLLLSVVQEPGGLKTLSDTLVYMLRVTPMMTQDTVGHVREMLKLDPEWDPIPDTWEWVTVQRARKEGEEKGMEKGKKEGREEGREEGMEKGVRHMLAMQLKARFGSLAEQSEAMLSDARLDMLETWSQRILSAQNQDEVFVQRPCPHPTV